jgi:hypothetical protein
MPSNSFLLYPILLLCFLYLGALFLAFLLRSPSDLPVREEGAKERVPGPVNRFRQEKIGRELPFVREAARRCAADYAVRYSSAIKRLRRG